MNRNHNSNLQSDNILIHPPHTMWDDNFLKNLTINLGSRYTVLLNVIPAESEIFIIFFSQQLNTHQVGRYKNHQITKITPEMDELAPVINRMQFSVSNFEKYKSLKISKNKPKLGFFFSRNPGWPYSEQRAATHVN